MPVVSRFYGIAEKMYADDHRWPHFRVAYGERLGRVSIRNPAHQDGRLPPRVRRLAREWARLHKAELLANWERCERGEPVLPIAPLE